ncbi:MAG: sulfite exporter TauE/SafE family protein [Clostridia bacterium]|nr:sulfite exporter TauE/SafE family protein [Clostridia bacterium]
MQFYWYLFLGFLGGIPAGMGMGGGTVTIPLLTIVGGAAQKVAQAANLFAFAPMSLPTLKMHAKEGLLKTDGLLWTIVPALLFSAAGALIASYLPGALLKKAFGAFLLGLSFFTLKGALSQGGERKTD